MPWPELGDKHTQAQDAEDFVEVFETICNMANNGQGMEASEMLATLGNCFKRGPEDDLRQYRQGSS